MQLITCSTNKDTGFHRDWKDNLGEAHVNSRQRATGKLAQQNIAVIKLEVYEDVYWTDILQDLIAVKEILDGRGSVIWVVIIECEIITLDYWKINCFYFDPGCN